MGFKEGYMVFAYLSKPNSVYPHLITGILFPFTYIHLTVLLLLNLILNLTFSPLLIRSSHLHASASDSFIDYWRYINDFD